MYAILRILPDLSMLKLSARCRGHENNLVISAQFCIHTVQLAQMDAVYKDIKVTAQSAIRIK